MIPLRFAHLNLNESEHLFVTDSGHPFWGGEDFLERYVTDDLTESDSQFLSRFDFQNGIYSIGQLYEIARRHHVPSSLNYFILVPTLRCDLECSYCQVSRVNEDRKGYDWDRDTTEKAIEYIAKQPSRHIKLEFQGGEPTLRLDIIERMLDKLEVAGKTVEIVICTNLSRIDDHLITLMDRGTVSISTSIDGSAVRQARQRTGSSEAANRIFDNFRTLSERFGPERLSAIATVNLDDPPMYEEIEGTYRELGLDMVFIRPINYQGFARKRHTSSRDTDQAWLSYYTGFIEYLLDHDGELADFYFTHLLKRVFQAGANGHVDLRNPSYFGIDYLVIDYDGRFFPSDEARMLDRIGEVDLSFGSLNEEIDTDRQTILNQQAFNEADPDCQHCVFQPYCGSDSIDGISRYARLDIPRGETSFCRTHYGLFSYLFGLLKELPPSREEKLSRWLGLPQVPTQFVETMP